MAASLNFVLLLCLLLLLLQGILAVTVVRARGLGGWQGEADPYVTLTLMDNAGVSGLVSCRATVSTHVATPIEAYKRTAGAHTQPAGVCTHSSNTRERRADEVGVWPWHDGVVH